MDLAQPSLLDFDGTGNGLIKTGKSEE